MEMLQLFKRLLILKTKAFVSVQIPYGTGIKIYITYRKEVTNMFPFSYYTPTKILFGRHTENQIGDLVQKTCCKKVLIHYGSGSVLRDSARHKSNLEGMKVMKKKFLMSRLAVLFQIPDCLLYIKVLNFAKKKR